MIAGLQSAQPVARPKRQGATLQSHDVLELPEASSHSKLPAIEIADEVAINLLKGRGAT